MGDTLKLYPNHSSRNGASPQGSPAVSLKGLSAQLLGSVECSALPGLVRRKERRVSGSTEAAGVPGPTWPAGGTAPLQEPAHVVPARLLPSLLNSWQHQGK